MLSLILAAAILVFIFTLGVYIWCQPSGQKGVDDVAGFHGPTTPARHIFFEGWYFKVFLVSLFFPHWQ